MSFILAPILWISSGIAQRVRAKLLRAPVAVYVILRIFPSTAS